MAGLLQVHEVVVNSVLGEDEIMERNILNVLKGQIVPPFGRIINIGSGFSKEATVERVLDYFRSNRDSLCSVKYTVRSQGHRFHYYPVHLAVVFKRTEILDLLYHLMREDGQFARQVLTLRVFDAEDVDPTVALKDKENKR